MWAERLLSIDTFVRLLRGDPPHGWLSPAEVDRLAELRGPDYRLRWLGGRWLAKQLLSRVVADPSLTRDAVHIESRDACGGACRPHVFLHGRLQPWRLSISHSERFLYVAAAAGAESGVGVDVTPQRFLPQGFADFWLTPAERDWCRRRDEGLSACLVWSLKESWYKAAGGNQPFVPRRWDVGPAVAALRPSSAQEIVAGLAADQVWRWADGASHVVCRRLHGQVATLVVLHQQHPRQAGQRHLDPAGALSTSPPLAKETKS